MIIWNLWQVLAIFVKSQLLMFWTFIIVSNIQKILITLLLNINKK